MDGSAISPVGRGDAAKHFRRSSRQAAAGFRTDDQAGHGIGARLADDRRPMIPIPTISSTGCGIPPSSSTRWASLIADGTYRPGRGAATSKIFFRFSLALAPISTGALWRQRRRAAGRRTPRSNNISAPTTNCAPCSATRFLARRASIRMERSTSRNGRGRSTTGRRCVRSRLAAVAARGRRRRRGQGLGAQRFSIADLAFIHRSLARAFLRHLGRRTRAPLLYAAGPICGARRRRRLAGRIGRALPRAEVPGGGARNQRAARRSLGAGGRLLSQPARRGVRRVGQGARHRDNPRRHSRGKGRRAP